MKKYFSTVFAFFCFAALLCCIGISVSGTGSSTSFYSDVLRFHILANSDLPEDQNLKCKVRDGVADLIEDLFSECESVDEALDVANQNRLLLEDAAKRILEKNESSQTVQVTVGRQRYPQKNYGGVVFPEGEYLSVRMVIGEGKGQNWWCVLFPSLCNVGVEREITQNENDKGIEILGCRVKLKIMEFFE